MAAATKMVHVRVDEKVKDQAAKALAAMGLSVSDAVRMLLVRTAAEKALPFDVKIPNAKTIAAMRELKDSKFRKTAKKYKTVEALMADLNS